MDDKKVVTEREAVKRERAAFLKGCDRLHLRCAMPSECIVCVENAAKAFPLPKVERPRVVTDPEDYGREICISPESGGFVSRAKSTNLATYVWCGLSRPITPETVRALADLLANPVELVEDES